MYMYLCVCGCAYVCVAVSVLAHTCVQAHKSRYPRKAEDGIILQDPEIQMIMGVLMWVMGANPVSEELNKLIVLQTG